MRARALLIEALVGGHIGSSGGRCVLLDGQVYRVRRSRYDRHSGGGLALGSL